MMSYFILIISQQDFNYSGTIQLVEGILRKIPPVVWLKGYSILLYKVYKRSICSINCGLLDQLQHPIDQIDNFKGFNGL